MEEKQCTILVVDDERIVREGCRRILEAEGYNVLLAENGNSAQDIVRSSSVDLVIADLKMPGMGGLELLAWMKEHHPSVPAIVITGHGGGNLETRCQEAGARGLVTKPFLASEVVSAIRSVL